MRVLSVAWVIYDSRLEQFCKDCTGGGLVIKNLCEYIGEKVDSYLFIGRYELPEMLLGNIHIINTMNCKQRMGEEKSHIEKMVMQFENALDVIKPDIVNVHGIGEFSKLCILVCKKRGVPVVYTEHLFIGPSQIIEKYERVVEWEKELYKIPDLDIVAVSTGMKKRILDEFKNISKDKIKVIRNGTNFIADIVESDIKQKKHIASRKILLCVGTILKRKNQEQLIRAYKLLKKSIRDNLCIIFCGNDAMNGRLQQQIIENSLSEDFFWEGGVSSEEIKKYYSIADALIMPSLAEGLSIAVLEAITYGIPVIMFRNSECAEDLNDENVVCFAHNRSDQDLADAIEQWYDKEWDKKYIKQYAKNFTMGRMCQEYIGYYNEVMKSKVIIK